MFVIEYRDHIEELWKPLWIQNIPTMFKTWKEADYQYQTITRLLIEHSPKQYRVWKYVPSP